MKWKLQEKLRDRCLVDKAILLGGKRYQYIDNGSPILGVAHCDSVTCNDMSWTQEGPIVKSTSLDDRLGVHILLDILPSKGIITDILLTDDEEIGDSTAQLFTPSKKYNWIYQFDRRGTDCVTYSYDCMDKYVKEYFTLGQGSFSDICWLEHLGCGGMNVGTGYYNEHTKASYCNLKETYAQVNRFVKFYHALKDTHIEHVAAVWDNFLPTRKPRGKASLVDSYGDYIPDFTFAKEDLDGAATLLGFDDFVDLIWRKEFQTTRDATDWLETEIWELQRGYSKDWDKEGEDDVCLGY